MRSSISKVLTFTVLAATLAACGDGASITAPGEPASSLRADGSVPDAAMAVLPTTPTTALRPVTRTVPVGDLYVTKVIGPLGGTISLSSAGLTVTVPRGAVAANTTFQIHALAGTAIAYEFEPHGTKFPVPLIVRQSLQGTTTPLAMPSFVAGYFADKSQIVSSTLANVTEEIPVIGGMGFVSFPVWHFSGYLVSSGRR
jgi:hypothetical protein